MLDLSNKQKKTLIESTYRINAWVGAVRSGKSYVSLIRWLEYIQEAPPGNLVMIGRTATTIKHNIVDEICTLIGTDAKYYIGKNELKLWGRRIYLVGASDERAETKIRGSTFAGAYIDEATLIPESFWTMLLSRISIPQAKIFLTTNPDSPFHWLKKNYLDRQDELDLKTFEFYLEDNPSLTEEFKNNLKQEYRGLWYRRYIQGEWCLAEGTIYDFFDESLHCINFAPGLAAENYIGVDYGTTNPCAFLMLAHSPNQYPNMWIEKEYYYDSSQHNRQKTDSEYAQDLKDFIGDVPVKTIYMDPSAASFKLECQRNQIRNIMDADNEVLDGIRFVASLFINGTLKITRQCPNLIKEMGSYVWDSKSRDLGVDKPLKKNDHCFAEGSKIKTLSGDIPIESIGRGEKVLTPLGWKTVLKTFCHEDDVYEYDILGKKIQCTKEHKFYTNNGWKESSALIQSDIHVIDISEQICLKKLSYLTESNIEDIYPPRIYPIEDITERIKQIVLKDTVISIETFGNSIMEKYPSTTIFITSTEIPPTMILATSNVFQFLSTNPNILKCLQRNKKKLQDFIAKELDPLQKNGIDLKKAENGIGSMQKKHLKEDVQDCSNVNNVQKSMKQKNTMQQGFVRVNVSQNGEEIISLMMNLEFAQYVIKNIEQTNIAKQDVVLNHVPERYLGKQKVYNLHVEDINTYYASGILTLNCQDALRYLCYSCFGKNCGSQGRMTPEDIHKMRRKAGIF